MIERRDVDSSAGEWCFGGKVFCRANNVHKPVKIEGSSYVEWGTEYNRWWWRRKSKATNRMVSLVKERRKSRAVQWRYVVGQEQVGHRCLAIPSWFSWGDREPPWPHWSQARKHLVRSYSFAALSKTRLAAMSVDPGEGSSARELPFCILHPGRFQNLYVAITSSLDPTVSNTSSAAPAAPGRFNHKTRQNVGQ